MDEIESAEWSELESRVNRKENGEKREWSELERTELSKENGENMDE